MVREFLKQGSKKSKKGKLKGKSGDDPEVSNKDEIHANHIDTQELQPVKAVETPKKKPG